MALTKVTGHVVKPDTNIQFHNTKSTGIVTFTHTSNATSSTTGALQITGGVGIVKDLHVGGNVTVGGTLTYDDVTNIDSLGIITARSGINASGNSTFTGDVELTSTDSGGAAAPTLRLQRDSSSPANGDILGQIMFGGKDSTPNDENYASVAGKIIQAGAGGEHGAIQITTRKASSNVITANLTSTDYELLNGTNLSVDGNITGNGNFLLRSTDGGTAAAPELTLHRNSGSPANNDYLGEIHFRGKDSGGSSADYATITGKILSTTNGSERGILEFSHLKSGTETVTGRWRDDSLQLLNGTSLTVAGTLDVTGTSTLNLIESIGTSGHGAKLGGLSVGYDTLYATVQPFNGNFLHLNYNAGTHVKLGAAATKVDLDVNGDVYPKASGNRDLGLSGKKWRDVHATTYYGDGSNLTGITQTTINSNTNNYVVTATGTANTLQGESTLTYNASILNVISTTQGLGLNLRNTSNEYTRIIFDAARTGASSALGILEGKWNNGNSVCQIYLQSGDDTTNKDDGRISMVVNSAAGSNKTAFRIEPDASVQLPNDSQKLQLGNDQDLNIWHGGSNGYIDNETGNLSFRTTSSNTERLRIASDGTVHFYGNQTSAPEGDFGFRWDRNTNVNFQITNTNNTSVNSGARITLKSNIGTITGSYYNNGGFYLVNSANGYLNYYSNNILRVNINTNGDFFINPDNANGIPTTNGNVAKRFGIKSTLNNIIIGETTNASMHGLIFESRVTGRSGGARCSQLEMGDGVIRFYTAPSGGAVAERFQIKSDGFIQFSHQTDNVLHTISNSSRLRLFGGSSNTVNNGAVLTLHGVSHSSGNYADLAAGAGGHIQFRVGTSEKLRIQNDGNVGIARTTNNAQTSSTNSIYNLSINRESSANTYDGLNKSLNVDNQYTVQTFRATNSNRSSISQWYDVAHFRAWDINARVIIQAGGTFTGDQINIDLQSSYNSALSNGRSGPVLEVKRTEGHSGGRFTKVRIGCHNSNRQPILQVYFEGSATHNSVGSVTVTVHDYGSNYGHGGHRGEAKWSSPTTLNETWEELDIVESGCDYFNTSTTPAFTAFKSDNSNQIASGVYAFNNQQLDRGGDNYNTGTGKFTAPCDGVYYFIATLQMYGGSATVHARFQKNGVDVYNHGTNTPYYSEKHSAHANLNPFCLVQLSTGDYVECVRNGTTRGMQSAIAGFLVR